MIFNTPKINTTKSFCKDYVLDEIQPNKIVFDSNRLEYDLNSLLKTLSLGDFDLYVSTAFIFSNIFYPLNYLKTEIECNRLIKQFRMKMVGIQSGTTYSKLKKTENIGEIEFLFDILNNTFGLTEECVMTYDVFSHIRREIVDLLSYSWRVHTFGDQYKNMYGSKIGVDVASFESAMVLRKMLQNPTTAYDSWIRSIRGKRSYITRYHPELISL